MYPSSEFTVSTSSYFPIHFNMIQPIIYYPNNNLVNLSFLNTQQINFIPQNIRFYESNVIQHHVNYGYEQNQAYADGNADKEQEINQEIIREEQNIKHQNQLNYKISSSSNPRHKVIHKTVPKNDKKYGQNVQRNVMTNVGNQVITFLGNRKRSQQIYFDINKNDSEEDIVNFYKFIHKLRRRKRVPVYINQKKLLDLWYPEKQDIVNQKNYKTLRQMSHIFILNILPRYLLNSTRIRKQTKILHISTLRSILNLIRYRRRYS